MSLLHLILNTLIFEHNIITLLKYDFRVLFKTLKTENDEHGMIQLFVFIHLISFWFQGY